MLFLQHFETSVTDSVTDLVSLAGRHTLFDVAQLPEDEREWLYLLFSKQVYCSPTTVQVMVVFIFVIRVAE
ncbi:MAG: hypothetical protein ACJAV1_002661 [Paraglaciecola sp.]